MKKALIGYGGHAREVMAQMGVKLTCFVDDQYVVENTLPLSDFDPNEYIVMIAVADSKSRFDIVQRLPKETKYFTWTYRRNSSGNLLDCTITLYRNQFLRNRNFTKPINNNFFFFLLKKNNDDNIHKSETLKW